MVIQNKIIVLSDIHWDYKDNKSLWIEYLDKLKNNNYDILLNCGDTSSYNEQYIEALKECSNICKNILTVQGNHDVWLREEDNGINSWEKYLNRNKLISDMGFHSLDSNPYIINKIGFVGNMGWYDYSFKDKIVYDKYIKNDPMAYYLYFHKKIFPDGLARWNDAIMVDWGKNDREMTKYFSDLLEKDIIKIENDCDIICVILHHVPISRMLVKKDDHWNMGNAFSGSKIFGDIIKRHNKIKYVFCGHTHSYFNKIIKGIQYINVGSGYNQPNHTEVNICL